MLTSLATLNFSRVCYGFLPAETESYHTSQKRYTDTFYVEKNCYLVPMFRTECLTI